MTTRTLTTAERKRYAIARTRERRAAELAPLRAEVDRAVREVGWSRARPVVTGAMAPVHVSGPRGVWRRRMGKRTGARILAELAGLPVQCVFRIDTGPVSLPGRTVEPRSPS